MKVSTRGRYGLRALVDMVTYDASNVVSLTQIAARQNISLNYLEQVFAMLRRAGIVRSVKGANGGYILNAKMESLSVREILEVLEGEFSIVDVDYADTETDIIRSIVFEKLWNEINKSVENMLEETTLADLVDRYKEALTR